MNVTLHNGDCLEYMKGMPDKSVDAIITDPPYSERTHDDHRAGTGGYDDSDRKELGYDCLHEHDCEYLAKEFTRICRGWIVWMTDHTLAPIIMRELEKNGRYVFAPLPYYAPGSRVRLTGDGPSSWTDWIIVARTVMQSKWGTLPGGYVAGPGWSDKYITGGKPTRLMQALVRDYSKTGNTVFDPYMGAGTTGVACLLMKRDFIGCEIVKETFQISQKRISEAQLQGHLL